MNKMSVFFVAILSMGLTFGCASDPSVSGNERQSKPGNFAIISYNVLYGFNHGKSLKIGADWINEQKPNVVALQELNGFNKKRLEQTAGLWGHSYSEILKEPGFPVGLTSKEPIETIEKRLKGMHHGFLHCKTSGINFIVVHLAPFDFRKRQKETSAICAKVRNLIESNEMLVVLGDFNAVSPLDKEYLDSKSELLEFLIAKDKSYLRRQNLDNGRFDFSVMQKFLDFGLEDVCYKLLKDTRELDGSLPTMIRGRQAHAKFLRRIDYVLMDKNLSQNTVYAAIPREGNVNWISDHYPVVIRLHLSEK